MDFASVLPNPELAFAHRHSRGCCRFSADFAQGSKGLSEFYPRTEPVSSRIVSMGWVPPSHCGIRESSESCRSNQISSARSVHLFGHGHYLILQGSAPVGGGGGFYDFGFECFVRSFRDHGLFDRRSPSSGIHFFDCCSLVYGRLTADGARNSGRISGGGLRRS